MWQGTLEKMCDVDCWDMQKWINAIPFEDWPQQERIDKQIRPAMAHGDWHGFPKIAAPLVDQITDRPKQLNPTLSVVMPGHRIDPHNDTFGPEWICRVHVPLATNPFACFFIEDKRYRMEVGVAYKVNISRMHHVINYGHTPRIHFMFDVVGG